MRKHPQQLVPRKEWFTCNKPGFVPLEYVQYGVSCVITRFFISSWVYWLCLHLYPNHFLFKSSLILLQVMLSFNLLFLNGLSPFSKVLRQKQLPRPYTHAHFFVSYIKMHKIFRLDFLFKKDSLSSRQQVGCQSKVEDVFISA